MGCPNNGNTMCHRVWCYSLIEKSKPNCCFNNEHTYTFVGSKTKTCLFDKTPIYIHDIQWRYTLQ